MGAPHYTLGSGNVFADLELPNAEEELLKTDLAFEIARVIEERSLTAEHAAGLAGLAEPDISAIIHTGLDSFSVERLMDFLTDLGQDVEITVRPTRKEHGRVSVVVAA